MSAALQGRTYQPSDPSRVHQARTASRGLAYAVRTHARQKGGLDVEAPRVQGRVRGAAEPHLRGGRRHRGRGTQLRRGAHRAQRCRTARTAVGQQVAHDGRIRSLKRSIS